MHHCWPRTTACMLALLLAACAAVPAAPSRQTEPVSPSLLDDSGGAASEATSVLRYFDYINKLDGPALEREHAALSPALARDDSAANRLRMVLLTSLPRSPVANEAAALALLEPVLSEAGTVSPGLHDLAILLRAMLEERAALGARLQATSAKFLEERKRADSIQQKLTIEIEVLGQRLKDQQTRSELLEKKIEEVKLIEKSMTERPPTTPRRQ